MKRNYFDPEMNISTFSTEDVVTTSGGVTGTGSSAEAYNSAADTAKAEVAYETLQFTF